MIKFWVVLAAVAIRVFLYTMTSSDREPAGYCPVSEKAKLQVVESLATDVDNIRQLTPLLRNISWECFFGNDYMEMRENFRGSASRLGLSLHTAPLKNFPTISTDAVVWKNSRNKNVLVHISGVHGPEGYSGSAIQHAFLEIIERCKSSASCSERMKGWPSIVLIHAANAYGFANNRRFTEENIDLNRNFLTEKEFEHVTTRDQNFAGYVTVDPDFNIQKSLMRDYLDESNPWIVNQLFLRINEISDYLRSAVLAVKYGMVYLKRAMVSGNYYKATGVYYGGQGLSEAAKGLIQLTEKLVNPFTDPLLAELPSGSQCTGETNTCSASSTSDMRILLMDVHTGLGPSGIDTLAPEHAADIPFYDKLFPKEYAVERSGKFSRKVIGGLKDASVGAWYLGDGVDVLAHVALSGGNKAMEGYEHMVGGVCQGYFTHWFFPRIPVENKKCITQEFGTIPMIMVGQRTAAENYAHHHGHPLEKEFTKEQIKNAFFVNGTKWKRNVVRRGILTMFQAIHRLSIDTNE